MTSPASPTAHALSLIAADMAQVDVVIGERLASDVPLVGQVARYIIASGGKDAGLRSDGNSKPLFITGPQHWKEMAQRLGLNEVMLIDSNRNVEMTPAMEQRMVRDSAPAHS